MVPKRFLSAIALVLLLTVSFAFAAKEEGLTGSIEAFRVVVTEDGRENFLPAAKAQPKDVIEYRLTYKNRGENEVRNIFITDPIPSGTQYIESSASLPVKGNVEFSVDGGKSYKSWPIEMVETTKDGREIVSYATPDMVTHIRWVVNETFTPEHEITVSYRTRIQ